MFYQVCVWYPTKWAPYLISIQPFVFVHVIQKYFTKVQIDFPILIGAHAYDCITWTVDLHHESLDFFALFNSHETNIDVIKNICREYIE